MRHAKTPIEDLIKFQDSQLNRARKRMRDAVDGKKMRPETRTELLLNMQLVRDRLRLLQRYENGDLATAESTRLLKAAQEPPAPRPRPPSHDIVFEPGAPDVPGVLNLYHGMPMKPVHGNCSDVLRLLLTLCDNNVRWCNWVLDWIAYPLQNPGAKLGMAIVMIAPPGAGKSVFWSLVREIYGEYGVVADRRQVDATFTDWLSAKLFVQLDEIEFRGHTQLDRRLRHLICDSELQIEQKFKQARIESNHMNWVMLGSEPRPSLDMDERRAVLIHSHQASNELAKTVASSPRGPLAAAFYHYLLNMDLQAFDPNVRPDFSIRAAA